MHNRARIEPRAYPIGEEPGKITSRYGMLRADRRTMAIAVTAVSLLALVGRPVRRLARAIGSLWSRTRAQVVCLGTAVVDGRLVHAFSDGTLLPVIAGGAINMTVELPTLMRVEEFARECGIARSTAWEIVRKGEIETVIVGERSRRIPRDAFEQYIKGLRNAEKAS